MERSPHVESVTAYYPGDLSAEVPREPSKKSSARGNRERYRKDPDYRIRQIEAAKERQRRRLLTDPWFAEYRKLVSRKGNERRSMEHHLDRAAKMEKKYLLTVKQLEEHKKKRESDGSTASPNFAKGDLRE